MVSSRGKGREGEQGVSHTAQTGLSVDPRCPHSLLPVLGLRARTESEGLVGMRTTARTQIRMRETLWKPDMKAQMPAYIHKNILVTIFESSPVSQYSMMGWGPGK